AYQGFMSEHFGRCAQGIKVVVDSGNGTAGPVAPDVYREMGCEVTELFSEPDGNFPNHHPDPTVPENIAACIAKVLELGADLGVAFDGDADRVGVIDEYGRVIWGDEMLVVFARDILAEHPGATVVSEVKCSQRLYDDIEAHGGKAIMWKAGHSLLKAKMRETGALLGGEMSGHLFFADRYYGYDDGIYAGARMIEVLARGGKRVAEILSDLPVAVFTPEIRVDCPDDLKFKLAAAAQQRFRDLGYNIVDVDGVRVLFEKGWGLIRASNTQPILVLRFEADNDTHLAEYRAVVETELARLREQCENA
ncbi:MAG: phosphomannomutase/phosphoglucomutase, partial [Deltaproteobacteria bacterium]|nr:phosphomannomutase/phosphoglucomutase [Deltaproteobacteria bacterium]